DSSSPDDKDIRILQEKNKEIFKSNKRILRSKELWESKEKQ
ncbi:1412_t:CDS:1, partial [Acaulospora morrowiae]